MITFNDFNRVDTTQFNILEKSAYSLTIQSKRTGNCWYILDRYYKNINPLSVFKSLVYGSENHHYCNSADVPQALEVIKKAERLEINKRERYFRMRDLRL